MVPEGWEQFTLGEFMDFKNGLNTDKSQYGSGIKFVNVMDVFGNDFLTQEIIVGRKTPALIVSYSWCRSLSSCLITQLLSSRSSHLLA